MREPRNVQSTSTKQNLRGGPADMPDRGGPKPNVQTSSSQVTMGRKESPVAAFGARPSMGEVQTTSTKQDLSRSANSPYMKERLSETKPQLSFMGKRGKK